MQVEYIGYGNCSGYGVAAKHYMLALDSVGVDVVFRPIDSMISRWHLPEERVALKKLRNKVVTDPNPIQVFHLVPERQARYKFKRRKTTVGFAIFESTKAPDKWNKPLGQNNLVISPSDFCTQAFPHLDTVKIPHCINTEIWAPRDKKVNDKFTFLAIGSWSKRKGWEELYQAWKGMEDCHLKIVTDLKDKALNKFREYNNVSVHTKIEDMPGFMSQADAVVCPTLGEGFGYVGFQALALNIPLIVSDWSGVKEYANKDTASMIPVKKTKVLSMIDNIYQFKSCEWADINPEDIRVCMRDVVKRYTFHKKCSQRGCNFVRDHLSYGHVGKLFQTALKGIAT